MEKALLFFDLICINIIPCGSVFSYNLFCRDEEMANHGFVAKHKPNNLPIFENYGDEPDDDFIYSVKLEYLKAIITQLRSNNVELVVVFPPYYRKLRHEGNPYSKRVITELCRENGIR